MLRFFCFVKSNFGDNFGCSRDHLTFYFRQENMFAVFKTPVGSFLFDVNICIYLYMYIYLLSNILGISTIHYIWDILFNNQLGCIIWFLFVILRYRMMKYHPNPCKRPPAIKHGVLENPPFSSKIVQLNPAFIDDFPGYKPLSIEDVQLLRYRRSAGWWFGTFWNIFLFFRSVGNNNPNWLSLHHFSEGLGSTTNRHRPVQLLRRRWSRCCWSWRSQRMWRCVLRRWDASGTVAAGRPGSMMWGSKLQNLLPGLVNIQKTMENHHFSWVNQLFLWPCSIAMFVYQMVMSTPD